MIDGERAIGEYVQGVGDDVNVNLRANGPSVEALAKLQVARISLAGGLFRTALNAANAAAQGLLAQRQ